MLREYLIEFEEDPMKLDFPVLLFSVYFLYYAGQSIYNTYLNLYLNEIGLDYTEIGFIVSFSTVFLLIAQLFWARISDKSRNKVHIISLLLLLIALICFLFYIGSSFLLMLAVVTLFSLFFNPVVPLLDNYSVEYIEKRGRFDYGQIRMGGTIGYCLTVLLIGYFLSDSYKPVFFAISAFMFAAFLFSLFLPKIGGYDQDKNNHTERGVYKKLLGNKPLFCLIAFNLLFSMGTNFFHTFYPVYYVEIGGNSSLIGLMMFLCSFTEIPSLMIIGKLERRFGIRRVLVFSGFLTALRWLLLFLVTNPIAAIFINLLHGPCFTSFNYSIITYIGKSVPKELRATGQSLNSLISIIGSKVVFGFIGGLASSVVGPQNVMGISFLIIFTATLVFLFWSRRYKDFLPDIEK